MQTIEPGYYEMRCVVRSDDGETETKYRSYQYLISVDSLKQTKVEWVTLLENQGYTILQPPTHKFVATKPDALWGI